MEAKHVGIRELKAHLSKYLKSVKAGSEIMISERGNVIARIIPFNKKPKQSPIETILLKLSEEGKIILPVAYKKPTLPLSRRNLKVHLFLML